MINPAQVAASIPQHARPLHARPAVRAVLGDTLRPGGLALTGRLLELANLPQPARMLDLGCGAGASAAMLRAAGHRCLGLDLAPPPTAAAPLLRADAHHLPLADASMDAVLCECALSCMDDAATVLQEVARVLVPGGRLLFADLYARAEAASIATAGCLQGMRTPESWLAALTAAKFGVMALEDQSRLLADLAARLVFAGALDACELGSVRPGYMLCVAKKME